jgi:flagellar hook assembly protein FlgD
MFAVDLATPGPLTVAVYDLKGRLVRTLVEDSWWPSGSGTLSWDGRDQAGRQVASGIYLVQGRSADETASTRIVRVR